MKKFIVITLGVLVFMGACINSNNSSVAALDETANTEEVTDSVNTDTNKVSEKTWDFTSDTDDMDDSVNKYYSLRSDNFANFDFPYQGDYYLTITVRYMKKYGYDVLLNIDKGQMVGNEYNGTNYVRLRFDNGKAEKYYYNQDLTGPLGIVIGNEGKGISEKVKKNCDFNVKIPMKGKVTSLNAAVSTGIIVYEAVKQRIVKQERK